MEKERRVELLRRQIMRRMMNQGITRGWSAWHELWQAKTYALNRLRQVGNKLRAPEIAETFNVWSVSSLQAKHEAERNKLKEQMRKEAGLRGDALTQTEKLQMQVSALVQFHDVSPRQSRSLIWPCAAASSHLAPCLGMQVHQLELRLQAADREKEAALKRQLVELTGSSEEIMAMRAEREKEERIEALSKKSARRLLNSGLTNAWEAWFELWDAKR